MYIEGKLFIANKTLGFVEGSLIVCIEDAHSKYPGFKLILGRMESYWRNNSSLFFYPISYTTLIP